MADKQNELKLIRMNEVEATEMVLVYHGVGQYNAHVPHCILL